MTANIAQANILLVDDEPHVTAALSRHFPKQNYQVFSAASAVEAYAILDRGRIDVVVSDERMPGETGAEFLGNVRRRFPKTIRIMLSGQASLKAAIRAINDGEVYRYFLKPCDPVDLVFTVQRALEHRQLAERSWTLLREFRMQARLLLAAQSGQLLEVQRDASGAVLLEEGDSEPSVEELLKEMETSLARERLRLTHLMDTQALKAVTDSVRVRADGSG